VQTRAESIKESVTNIAIGYLVALLSQLIVFPLVGVHVDFTTNLEIGLYFTIISLVRSYLVRRWFNRKEKE
jgi:membrane protein implicated in regulation of membrane protease activity